jgi:16S rRNA (uracil1498-N3)-methyltransferase
MQQQGPADLESCGPSRCRIHLAVELQAGREVAIPAEQAHYLRHVMRLNTGDAITIFNGRGGEYRASIAGLAKAHATCRIEAFDDVSRELPLAVHIIQSASRSEKIETVLQKCTELGAAGFQIVVGERSQFKLPDGKREARLERWRRIIIEAAEQSGRTLIPALSYRDSFADLVLQQQAYVLHPAAEKQFAGIREHLSSAAGISLAIGPEGGFSERDLQQLQGMGCHPLCFGPRIMRTETAAPALLAAIAGTF